MLMQFHLVPKVLSSSHQRLLPLVWVFVPIRCSSLQNFFSRMGFSSKMFKCVNISKLPEVAAFTRRNSRHFSYRRLLRSPKELKLNVLKFLKTSCSNSRITFLNSFKRSLICLFPGLGASTSCAALMSF